MSGAFIASDAEAKVRLDQLLARRFPEHSRAYFQELIREGHVRLNGEGVKKRTVVAAGDLVAVELIEWSQPTLEAEPVPLDILYEDSALIVVNKPAGLVVHPGAGNWTGTFANGLIYHCKQLEGAKGLRPGIVHRLDKETSGVLIAAKREGVQQKLTESFAARQVEKTYLALCVGSPGEQTVTKSLGRHPRDRKKRAVVDGGKEAISHITSLASANGIALVQVRPETGRTHQIRVHLKAIGNPVLGDGVYGDKGMNQRWGAKRQMLHAHRIGFAHPVSGKSLLFIAPLPDDFTALLVTLGIPTP